MSVTKCRQQAKHTPECSITVSRDMMQWAESRVVEMIDMNYVKSPMRLMAEAYLLAINDVTQIKGHSQ